MASAGTPPGSLPATPASPASSCVAEHQLVPELAFDLSLASLVVLLDASTETPAGTVTVRSMAAPSEAAPGTPDRPGGPGVTPGASSHHVGPELLLTLARELYGRAPEAVVVSVGVTEMGLGESLTPSVEAALPAVADIVARLVAEHEERAENEAHRPA